MAHQPRTVAWNIRHLLFLAIALIAFYVVIPQIGSFQQSLPLLMQAQPGDITWALICVLLTYAAGAGTYCLLALRHLAYRRTILIQVAGMFVNRLLPAGIGSIGVNYAYLRKVRHSRTQAASVVALNNTLGIFGHLILLVILLLLFRESLPPLQVGWPGWPVLAGIISLALVVWVAVYRVYGQRLLRALRKFGNQLLSYRQRPGHLAAALACSISLTLVNALALWFCVSAMGGSLPFISVFLIFTFGIALGTATPTPGGLGGIEIGLVAGLMAYQVDEAAALAIVLLYRMLTYWLPLVAGSTAFIYSQKRGYF